ncbi:MAG: sugar ABC transporter substrate-binding protein [Mesorhizobium sp.]|nr:sugar ABC transporter substrate-binding protein [Mesorhizobium sp.]
MSAYSNIKRLTRLALASALALSFAAPAVAQDADRVESLRQPYVDAVKGKKVVFLVTTLGVDLTAAWHKVFTDTSAKLGIDYSVRDSNWNTQAQVQAFDALLGEKPDAIIIQNWNLSLTARQIKKAEEEGIIVIQLNQKSLMNSTAHVGVDWTGVGVVTAQEMVKQCGKDSGRSGKVAIIQGDVTASDSFYQMAGVESVFAEHPEMSIVANQGGQWDPNKAHDLAVTMLQQHPDLCAFYGMWGVMAMGVGQAISEAGLKGKVFSYSNDGGSRYACDAVKSGDFTKFWSYDAPNQARDVMQLLTYLFQNDYTPGTLKGAIYSPLQEISLENYSDTLCWDPAKK